jgi:NitT/TauT family transport system permease protein
MPALKTDPSILAKPIAAEPAKSGVDRTAGRTWLARNFKVVGPLTLLIVLLAVWELIGFFEIIGPRVFPKPSLVFPAIVDVVQKDYFLRHFSATMYQIGVGYLYAVVLGVVLGVVLAYNSFLRSAIMPLVIVLEVIPKVALIPLIIVYFGYDEQSKIVVVTLIAFFPIFLNTLSGLSELDPEGTKLLRSLGANPLQHFRMHRLPVALPAIFAGLRIGLTLAFIGAIVAELLTKNKGLGYLLLSFSYQLLVDYVFAITIILAILGASMFLLVEFIERKVVFWHNDDDANDTASS